MAYTPEEEAANWKRCEDEAWRDAWQIAWVGASNPVAVERTLRRHRAVLGDDHLSVQAIAGQLAYLRRESLGPSEEVLAELEAQAFRLKLL